MPAGPLQLFDPPPSGHASDGDPHPSFRSISSTLFRCVDYDTPVWAGPNRRAGRWHFGDRRVTAQYWCYSATTAWAEVLRGQGVRTEADVGEMRTKVWAGRIEFTQVADLTDPSWTDWLGLDPSDLITDSHDRCRAASERLLACGARGLIAPSAALPDHNNVVLYARMVRGDWVEGPDGPERLKFPEKVLPCHLLAYGHPSPDLVHRVRYRESSAL